MGQAAFWGYLFLSGSPLATVYIFCIARKSFLVLLSLASAFYWLVTLFLISALFRGFSPLSPSTGPYVGLILTAVLIQEAARFLLWRFHKLSLRTLAFVSTLEEHRGSELLPNDHFSLSLTHGLAHSIVHTLFFCISWLPLSLGDGTIYAETCPQMSYYLVCSLTTLGFAGILAGAMVLAFEGLERHDWKRGALLPVTLHLLGGLLTLVNFSQGGCVVSVSLILAEGIFVGVYTGKVWWKCTDPTEQRHQRSLSEERRRSSSRRHSGNVVVAHNTGVDTGVVDIVRSPRRGVVGTGGAEEAVQQQHIE